MIGSRKEEEEAFTILLKQPCPSLDLNPACRDKMLSPYPSTARATTKLWQYVACHNVWSKTLLKAGIQIDEFSLISLIVHPFW